MSWNIFNLELIVFITILFCYMKLRKGSIFSMKMVRGLTTYVPPMDEDFDMLEKTNKGGRENFKGEVNKYDKKKLPAKAKFPLRTIEINEAFLKHSQEFFVEYDFFFMLFTVLLVLFVITQTIKMVMPSLLESNLVFYMMVFLLFMTTVNLMKHTFSRGYCQFSDETKIEFLFAIKAFATVFVCLKYIGSKAIFGCEIEKAHD